MPVNFVRGFRRIGWLPTIPLAALIVLVLYEKAKVLSTDNYDVIWNQGLAPYTSDPRFSPINPQKPVNPGDAIWQEGDEEKIREEAQKHPIEIPGLGTARFETDRNYESVPSEIVQEITKDFVAKNKPPVPPPGYKLEPWFFDFTVHKQVSKLRLIGLIAGSFLISALIIQGSISILAWVLRGFKGTTHIDVS